MGNAQHKGELEFRVIWGIVEVKVGRDHPNINPRFNSEAAVESARVYLREANPGVLLHARHRDFEGGVLGSVLTESRERAAELAAFLSERKGKTIDEVAAEVRASGFFNPVL